MTTPFDCKAFDTLTEATKSAKNYTRRTGVLLAIKHHCRYDRNGLLLQEWYTRTSSLTQIGGGGSVASKYTVETIQVGRR